MQTNLAVVFDLDGTLIDSVPDIAAAANSTFARYGAAPFDVATIRSFVGKGAPNLINMAREHAGLPADLQDEILDRFLVAYETAYDLTCFYPGVAQMLDTLSAAGCTLGVCTNKPAGPTHAVLAHFGLTGMFAAVIAGDSLPQRKPDPTPLLTIARDLGCARTVFVGDSEVDAETAQNARMEFALFTEGYRKSPISEMPHTWAFDDFNALPGLLGL